MGNDAGTAPSTSRVRRFAGIAVPVVVLAVAAPLLVNGIAAAVNEVVPETTVAPAASEPEATVATASPTTTTMVSPTTVVGSETVVSIDGLAADADDRTISLATEIVAGSATTTATDNGATTPTTAPSAAGHSHGAITPEVALTRTERADLAAQLTTARTAADRYPTVADAVAGGYALITGYLPLIGAHYIKWDQMDATFDPAAPEMLLYDGTTDDSHIVGLSYYLFSDTEPSPFVGGNDHWHQHIGLCIKDGVVVGGESTTQAECAERGGAKAGATNGWMVHAWVVPGWDSPQGVFSPEHPGLTADLPTS